MTISWVNPNLISYTAQRKLMFDNVGLADPTISIRDYLKLMNHDLEMQRYSDVKDEELDHQRAERHALILFL